MPQPGRQKNPFTLLRNDKRTLVRCVEEMCELWGDLLR